MAPQTSHSHRTQRSRSTAGYRASTAAHEARKLATPLGLAGRRSVAHPALPGRAYTPDAVAKNEIFKPTEKAAYSTAPWKERLQLLSPLTNNSKTSQHFPVQYSRFGSEEWRARSKRRTSTIPLQSHDRSTVSDSHLLRTFQDDFLAPPSVQCQQGRTIKISDRTNQRENHSGLVPGMPDVMWNDSKLTFKMADGTLQGGPHVHRKTHGRGAIVSSGRESFPLDLYTPPPVAQSTNPKRSPVPAYSDLCDYRRLSSAPDWPAKASQRTAVQAGGLGAPALVHYEPQDAVFAGRAAQARPGQESLHAQMS